MVEARGRIAAKVYRILITGYFVNILMFKVFKAWASNDNRGSVMQ